MSNDKLLNNDKDNYIKPKKNYNHILENDDIENGDIENGDFENGDFENGDIENGDNIDYIEEDIGKIENNDFDLIYRLNTNKHRQEGKHSLKRDTIFKGKLDEKQDIDNPEYQHFDNDLSSNDPFKLIDVEYDDDNQVISQNELKKDVYNILDKETDLDFTQNRRKPNKDTFNYYYDILTRELDIKYTKSEIFVELSYYFTDNIFNMFKLLDKVPASIIIKELMQKGYLKNIKGIEFL